VNKSGTIQARYRAAILGSFVGAFGNRPMPHQWPVKMRAFPETALDGCFALGWEFPSRSTISSPGSRADRNTIARTSVSTFCTGACFRICLVLLVFIMAGCVDDGSKRRSIALAQPNIPYSEPTLRSAIWTNAVQRNQHARTLRSRETPAFGTKRRRQSPADTNASGARNDRYGVKVPSTEKVKRSTMHRIPRPE